MTRILPRGVVTASVRDVYGDTARVTAGLVDRYYELTRRTGNRGALPSRFSQSRPGADTALLSRVTMPTLLMWGARDRLIPAATAARFQHMLPGSRLIVYPGLGHVPHEEDPVRTATDALAFLSPS
jgi:pimeloyl-ACP methyl ester carboxylesterase